MPKRALVVIPTFAGVLPRPFKSFLDIALVAGRACPDWRFAFHTPERQSLPKAMGDAAEMVKTQTFDALIAFDDDCFPPYDCVPRLLGHLEDGHDIVAGLGVMRCFPHTTTVGMEFPEGLTLVEGPKGATLRAHMWRDSIADTGVVPVDFCGFPVVAIASRVFRDVPPPYFDLRAANGATVTHDVFFCQKVRTYGFQPEVDTTVKCGHLAEAPVITFENRAHARELVETPA